MLSSETTALIKRLHYAEHLTMNGVAEHLGIHHDTVRSVLQRERRASLNSPITAPSKLDPFMTLIRERLETYPKIKSTRLIQMLRDRGYDGSIEILRRRVKELRPQTRRAFLPLTSFIGDEAQVDWASFGTLKIGRAERKLSCFAMVLSYSRALFAGFTFDQTIESFLRCHIEAFRHFGGVARRLRYDNLRAAVVERHGTAVRFNETLLDFAGHYRFEPSACNPYSGHEKGKVERSIRYIRDNFFVARKFNSIGDANAQIKQWLDNTANQRPWPDNRDKSIASVWEEEKMRLLSISDNDFSVVEQRVVRSGKTPYIRYDLNDYSIPFELVQKPITLLADETKIRLVDAGKEIASHARSFDRGERVTNRDHFAGLYERRPGGHAVASREYLAKTVENADAFFELMVEQGEPLGSAAAKLTDALHDYGAKTLATAIKQALDLKIGRYVYVLRLCQQIEKQSKDHKPLPLDLSLHPELQQIDVKPHNLNDYDTPSTLEENHDIR